MGVLLFDPHGLQPAPAHGGWLYLQAARAAWRFEQRLQFDSHSREAVAEQPLPQAQMLRAAAHGAFQPLFIRRHKLFCAAVQAVFRACPGQ